MKIWKILAIILAVLVILVIGVTITGYVMTKDSKLNEENLQGNKAKTLIIDDKGNTLSVKNSHYTPYDEINESIITTFVAVEDKRFFEHSGIDYIRIFGAMINNIKTRSFSEGASTISQQLIKNTHLTGEKTIKRKLNEIKLAKELEKRYSKEKILEMYLNAIYFGNSIYGIYDACIAYFDKTPLEINLAEASMIAGVVKNPAQNSPLINLNGAKKRQKIIFDILEKQGKIDESIINNARKYNITLKNGLKENNITHLYTQNAIYEASKILNINEKDLIKNGYKIETYLDQKLQDKLYKKVNENYDLENIYYNYSITDNITRGIKAYLSNVPLTYDNITRQAGSTIKPLIYLSAFEQGTINSLSVIEDEPININGYSPQNYNNVYHGKVNIADSIIHSYNIPAVKVLEHTGIDITTEFLQRFNIKINVKDQNLSLALGSNTVSPYNIAEAYCTIANNGEYKKIGFVKTITDDDGKVIYSHPAIAKKQVINKEDSFIMTDILRRTSQYGTARKLKDFNFDIASKTGTVANNGQNTDGWCVSYTAKDTVTVWHGAKMNDKLDNKHIGGGMPTVITRDIYNILYPTDYSERFSPPDNLILCKIDKDKLYNQNKILRLDDNTNREYLTEYFRINDLPSYYTETNKPIPYTLTRKNGCNIIEFDCLSGFSYEIYYVEDNELQLVKTLHSNGNKARILDRRFSFWNDYKYVIKIID